MTSRARLNSGTDIKSPVKAPIVESSDEDDVCCICLEDGVLVPTCEQCNCLMHNVCYVKCLSRGYQACIVCQKVTESTTASLMYIQQTSLSATDLTFMAFARYMMLKLNSRYPLSTNIIPFICCLFTAFVATVIVGYIQSVDLNKDLDELSFVDLFSSTNLNLKCIPLESYLYRMILSERQSKSSRAKPQGFASKYVPTGNRSPGPPVHTPSGVSTWKLVSKYHSYISEPSGTYQACLNMDGEVKLVKTEILQLLESYRTKKL